MSYPPPASGYSRSFEAINHATHDSIGDTHEQDMQRGRVIPNRGFFVRQLNQTACRLRHMNCLSAIGANRHDGNFAANQFACRFHIVLSGRGKVFEFRNARDVF